MDLQLIQGGVLGVEALFVSSYTTDTRDRSQANVQVPFKSPRYPFHTIKLTRPELIVFFNKPVVYDMLLIYHFIDFNTRSLVCFWLQITN